MRLSISKKEYDDTRSKAESNTTVVDFMQIVDNFVDDCELLIDSDRQETITQQRALWRDICYKKFNEEYALEKYISACIFILTTWAEADHFMINILTPFEQAVVIENIGRSLLSQEQNV